MVALAAFGLPVGAALASTTDAGSPASQIICQGYTTCQKRGYAHSGYATANRNMYWQMYAGTNCTNYVAFRMVQAGMANKRPWTVKPPNGNATYWGTKMASITDATPMVGAVAWWKANVPGAGSAGHVAYVEQVVSPTEIIVSESNYGSEFDWRRITRKGPWPSGFIHFRDVALQATAAPTVVGTPQVGVTLRSTPGSWKPGGSYRYQWTANGAAVSGATGTTFTPGPTELGKRIALTVTAARTAYRSGVSTSAATTSTAAGVQAVQQPPVIEGTPQVDQTLTADPGAYSPSPQTAKVQWLADGVAIPGATAKTFVPRQQQAGTRLSVAVTTARPGYATRTTTSTPTPPVLAPDIRVVRPGAITGARVVGQRLTASPGVLDPKDARAAYTWFRDGTPIAGATGATYLLQRFDIGRSISAQVQLTRPGYRDKSVLLPAVSGIKAPVTLRVRAGGRRPGRVTVEVTASAPAGRRLPTGRIFVTIAGTTRSAALVDGVVRIAFSGLRAGSRTASIAYKGDARVLGGRTTATVRVRGKGGR